VFGLPKRCRPWPRGEGGDGGVDVAPRLRATGLPCVASPETMSSGNTQHIGTEYNRFIDASGTEFILQQRSRPSGTLGAAKQYVHYLVNIKGASTRTTTWQQYNIVAEAPYHRDTDVDTI
jgi:hypothetical protein